MNDRLTQSPEIEVVAARFEQNLRTWLEFFTDLLEVGDRDSMEILLEEEGQPVAEIWDALSVQDRQRILETAGKIMGVNLLNIEPEQVVRSYRQEGVPGEKTEAGADVDVLNTGISGLDVHVLRYRNPALVIRYNLVRSALYA